jgi:hypothetical protein
MYLLENLTQGQDEALLLFKNNLVVEQIISFTTIKQK